MKQVFKLVLLSFLFALLYPTGATAQTIEPWGSNVVCHGSSEMFRTIKNTYGGSNWYPATVMIKTITGAENEYSAANTMLDSAREYKIYPILRPATYQIGKQWQKLDPEIAAGVVNKLETHGFPRKLIVVYGNEVNMNLEWGGQANPQEYKANFNRFVELLDTDRFIPIKAPINLSLPHNPDYHGLGASYFYAQMGSGLQTEGLDVHPYNLPVPYQANHGQCEDWSGQNLTIQNHIQVDVCHHNANDYGTSPLIATEFGDHPDKSIPERMTFLNDYYNRYPDGYPPLEFATPLLLDHARSNNEPTVAIFKESGGIEYIDCQNNMECGPNITCGEGAVDLSPGVYHSDKDSSPYTTIPLITDPEETQEHGEDLAEQLVWSMVVDHGYQVSCAAPQLLINPSAIGRLMDYFSSANTEHPATKQVLHLENRDSAKVDIEEAKVPIMRGSEASNQTDKVKSIEAYFGVINQDTVDIENTAASSGVAASLLSREQQFYLKLENLRRVKEICETLTNPNSCALHRQISNSDYYLYSTPEQEAAEPSLLTAVDSIGLGYQQLSGSWKQEYQSEYGVEQEKFIELADALSWTPLDIDNLYRFAFVILSPLQNTDEEPCIEDDSQRTDIFSYLNWNPNASSACVGNYINRGKRVPIWVAFKIPYFGTNQIRSLPLMDSASLVADTLYSSEVQNLAKELAPDSNREELYEQIMQVKRDVWDNGTDLQRASLIIDCHGMPQCMGAHDTGDESAMAIRQAIVHIVNGSNLDCKVFSQPANNEDIIYNRDNPNPISSIEKADEIGTDASVDISNQYRPEYFNFDSAVSAGSGSRNFDWNLYLKRGDAQKILDDGKNVVSQDIGLHLITPYGTDLTYLQSALSSFFEDEQIDKMIENNTMPDVEGGPKGVAKFIRMPESSAGYKSRATKTYRHEDCPDEYTIDEYGLRVKTGRKTDCAEAGVELDSDNFGISLNIARIGFFIRNVVNVVTESTSPIADYLQGCERIEDLFLGRCVAKSDANYGPPDGLPYNGSLGSGSCEPIASESSSDNPCHLDNLKSSLEAYIRRTKGLNEDESLPISEQELNKRATQASIICNAESGGNPNALNDGCLSGKSVDYSVGLFQINLLAHHCPEYFNYSWEPPQCEITASELAVTQCASEVLQPEVNIRKAWEISGAGSSWGAWATAKEKYCGPSLRAVE